MSDDRVKPMGDDGIEPYGLGARAHDFIGRQLARATEGWDAPLSRRLRSLRLEDSVCFLSPRGLAAVTSGTPRREEIDFETGGVASGADAAVARLIARWLAAPDPSHRRLLVLQELMAKWSDPGTGPPDVHLGEHLYVVRNAEAQADDIERSLRSLYGYPGIGILTCPEGAFAVREELSESDLEVMASAAVALLVRAWDDEGYLIAPVRSCFELERFVGEPIRLLGAHSI
jgi:hypothetical protein